MFDTVSMYTNIDTDHGLDIMNKRILIYTSRQYVINYDNKFRARNMVIGFGRCSDVQKKYITLT